MTNAPQRLPVQEQLKALEHLQELDLKIDALKKQKAGFPQALKSLDEALGKVNAQITAKQNELAEIEKTKRQTQAAIDLNNDRVARANSKLEAVQNGQEFQAANREIEQLKKLNTTLDEQIKKSAADTQSVTGQIEQLQAEVSKAKAARDEQASAFGSQTSQLDAQISELTGERQQFLERVEKRVLAQYDRVRMARGGLGLVPALGGRCKGCNMMVPPQLYNEIQRGDSVHACPSCHRILFVPASGQSAGLDAPAQQA